MSERRPFHAFCRHYFQMREDGYPIEEAVDIAATLTRIGEQLWFQTEAERGIAEIPTTTEVTA